MMITKAQKRNKRKAVKAAVALTLCTALASSMGVGSAFAARSYRDLMPDDGKYYTDFNTYDEAKAAGEEFTAEVAAEGQTLLKNKKNAYGNAALPLAGGERVSVFGVGSDAPAGNGVSIHEALKTEGFKVNPSLTSYYAAIGTTFGTEVNNFDKGLENSFKTYNDVAVVVISRGGGEGSDMPTVTKEEANDEKENNGWEHEGYVAQADGKEYKHFLQMTDSEYELFKYVKAQGFKKIVYLINVSEIFEIKNLADDDAVDGIIWMGRPGAKGALSTAGILSGRINPSGKTVDTWYSDFTSDPIWFNSINNAQAGSEIFYSYDGQDRDALRAQQGGGGFGGNSSTWNGIDYEEDIYVGYRYYETKAADMNKATAGSGDTWYANAVTYPFGYGLSYTEYEYSNMTVNLGKTALGNTLDASKIASSVGNAAQEDTLTITVDVKNNGNVAGKESVQVYLQAPYFTGEVEKSHVKLVGFGKTGMLRPQETETVTITVNVQDLASYDYTDANQNGYKGYELDEGAYSLMVLPNAHGWVDNNAVKHDFTISNGTKASGATGRAAAYLQLDDYSGEEIKNLFSKENGIFYSLRDNTGANKFNADATANEVLMSRANGFVLPKAPTTADLTMSLNMYKSLLYWDDFKIDTLVPDSVIAGNSTAANKVYYKDGQVIEGIVSADDFPWMAETAAATMTNWDQNGTYKYADGTTVKMSDMTGVDPYGTVAYTEDNAPVPAFVGKTGAEAWELFMNTLKWEDLMSIVGVKQKQAFPEISMNTMADGEFAYSVAGINFTCTCTLAATWNTELANRKGVIAANAMILQGKNVGWGTSANTHRSPFAGRVFEYTSEDGILGGYISAAETLGANSRGIATYTKHCALNDQETSRNGRNLFAWVSEQAMREIYYKSFQMVAQEGQSAGIMGAFARAGRVSINVNYNFVTGLFRDEWGCKTVSFTTDAYAGMKTCSPLDMLVRAGTDTISSNTMSGTWNATNKKVVVADAADTTSATNQWYTTRKCAMVFLWTHANTAMNKNGVTFNWTGDKAFTGKQGATVSNIKLNSGATGGKVEYVVSAGTLPAGLKLNADGSVTGAPTAKAGAYKFTVQCKIDNWVTSAQEYTYTVESGFALDADDVAVGEEYFGEITSDTVTKTTHTGGITYSVKAGKLPAGLTLNAANGEITGTPTESGDFAVTFQIAAIRVTGSGRNAQRTTENYEFDVTISIDGAAGSGNDHGGIVSSTINDKGELVLTYADGTSQNLGVVVGEDGKNGVDGKDGKDGKDGANGQNGADGSGCGGVIGATSAVFAALAVLGGAGLVLRKKKED